MVIISKASTFIPIASATCAVARPMRPKPTNPIVSPANFHQRKIPVAEIGASAPSPLGDPAGVIGHVQREIQQMGENHLHDRRRGIVGHVADRDAPLRAAATSTML